MTQLSCCLTFLLQIFQTSSNENEPLRFFPGKTQTSCICLNTYFLCIKQQKGWPDCLAVQAKQHLWSFVKVRNSIIFFSQFLDTRITVGKNCEQHVSCHRLWLKWYYQPYTEWQNTQPTHCELFLLHKNFNIQGYNCFFFVQLYT